MYSRRLIGNMSVRTLAWLAVAAAAQVGPAVAQHRDEYAVVLRDAPLARRVASRRELGSTPALDRAARIRGAQNTLREMIDARRRLNATASPPLEIGVGIASGAAVAGCMGSAQRMNYTVLGERVNLAARLCAHAGRMEVLIDDATRTRVTGRVGVEPVASMRLKGFADPVDVYRVRNAAVESVA